MQVEWGGTNAAARQTMELLSRWFKAGLIDPEFVTVDNAAITEKWANSTIGFMTVGDMVRLDPRRFLLRRRSLPSTRTPKSSLADPVKGPNGDFGYFNWGPITSSPMFHQANRSGTKRKWRERWK